MKKLLFILYLITGNLVTHAQSTLMSSSTKVSFFSSAPIEDIEALSTQGISRINAQTGMISFKIPVKSFQFDNSLMQRHFNSDYMESETYPDATFIGKLQDTSVLAKEGQIPVAVSGKLTIHGVTRSYSGPVTLRIKGNHTYAKTTFKIRLADYNIKIPTLLTRNIAEVVDVTVEATYTSDANPAPAQ